MRAQQTATPVVGFLSASSLDSLREPIVAFREALATFGYVEGSNVVIEYRTADNLYNRLPQLAADLVRRKVKVIVSLGGSPALLAAKAATTTIPIVFAFGGDPVARGIVASLNRPSGNLTRITVLADEVGPKRLELLHEVAANSYDFGLLVNPTNENAEILQRAMDAAARSLGVQLHLLRASTEHDLDAAFAALARLRAGGLVIGGDAFFNSRYEQFGALSTRYSIPAAYQYRTFVTAGGLMSYGTEQEEWGRQLGIYTARILRGEKPDDLPVQQVTQIRLVINMRTAKALGLTVPLSLLGRADEVIE